MRLKLPPIRAHVFSRSLVLRRARRSVESLLDQLGPVRLEYLISHNRPLSAYLDAEREAHYRRQAQGHRWVMEYLQGEDLLELIPPWAGKLIDRHGEEGRKWAEAQMEWLLDFFREDQDAGVGAIRRRRDQDRAPHYTPHRTPGHNDAPGPPPSPAGGKGAPPGEAEENRTGNGP